MFSFSETTPEKATAVITRLEARKAEALATLEHERSKYGSASLAVEEGLVGGADALTKCKKTMERAQSSFSEAEAALIAAKERLFGALTIAAEREAKRRREEGEQLATEGLKLAEELERQAKELFDVYEEFVKVRLKMYETVPQKQIRLADSPFTPNNVTAQFRQYLYKVGFTFACRYPWPPEQIPKLTDKVVEGNTYLLSAPIHIEPVGKDANENA